MKKSTVKSENNFIVKFPDEFCIDQNLIFHIEKPTYYNGEWASIKVEFIDSNKTLVTPILYRILSYVSEKESIGVHVVGGLFNINLIELDENKNNIIEWEINVGEIIEIFFGNFNSTNYKRNPSIILKPNKCKLL